jgi:phosphoesterase RecJ-like protein
MSLRSWGEVDVSAIASSLGGGGHANAAGGLLYTGMRDAEKRVLWRIAQELPELHGEASLNAGAH